MQTASDLTCYAKLKKASLFAFIILLGGGASMALGSTIIHNVVMWAMGTVLAGMSGIFVTLGLIAKSKLR